MGSRCTFARMSGALLALAIPGAVSAVQLNYELGFGVEHDDNVNLSETDPISDDILIPTLGFSVSQLGSTIQANATGLVEYRDYLGNTFSDDFRGELAGRFNWTVVPERLDFVVQDRLALEPINTLAPDAPSNLQQTNVIGLGPILNFRISSAMRGQAQLLYVDSYADQTDEFNSQRLGATLSAIRDLNPESSISANVVDERATFDNASVSPDYNHYGVFGRYKRTLAKFDLTGDLGYSWLRYSSSEPGLDRESPVMRADVVWHLAPRDTLTLDASYQFSDAASGMLANIGTPPPLDATGGAPTIPADVALGNATISSAPYLEKAISLSYGYQNERFQFTVAPYYHIYDYGAVTVTDVGAVDQNARGGTIGANWRLRPLLLVGVNATFENLTYDTISRTDRNRFYTAFLRHQWARNWSWHAELTRNERHSTQAGASSDENIVFVGVTFTR
jgi:hypothetical protein